MASVASEADRSLARVFIAVLAECCLTNELIGCLSEDVIKPSTQNRSKRI